VKDSSSLEQRLSDNRRLPKAAMADHNPGGADELQFDRAVVDSPAAGASGKLAVTCTSCQDAIEKEYYDVNGNVVCDRCRRAIESAAETPTGLMPLIVASVFGFGAGVVGAVIYFSVIAIAHLEIGIVAILIGYMVGYAVRKGARGRGGLRFQVIAVALTYLSVAFAYTPLVVKQAIDAQRTAHPAASMQSEAGRRAANDNARRATSPPGLIRALSAMALFILALPVLIVVSSLPSGLISGLIIFIGMRQAWKMTAAPWVQVLGPYRVGSDQAATLA
jgi:hypothetical protein